MPALWTWAAYVSTGTQFDFCPFTVRSSLHSTPKDRLKPTLPAQLPVGFHSQGVGASIPEGRENPTKYGVNGILVSMPPKFMLVMSCCAVYCNRSCLFVFVCVFVGLLP